MDDGQPVTCPVCGFERTRPFAVDVFPFDGTNGITVEAISQRIKDAQRGPDVRGVGIEIRFAGDCGHGWRHVYQFHQGQVTFSVVPIETIADELRPPNEPK